MADALNKLEIEVPFQGELWRVTFVHVAPPCLRVPARFEDRECVSWWRVTDQLESEAGLGERTIPARDFLRAVVHRYLHEFPGILAASSEGEYFLTYKELNPSDPEKQIERVAREIEDLIVELAELRPRLPTLGGELLLPSPSTWRVAETILGDTVPSEVDDFYDGYKELSAMASSSTRQLESFEAELRRVSILGSGLCCWVTTGLARRRFCGRLRSRYYGRAPRRRSLTGSWLARRLFAMHRSKMSLHSSGWSWLIIEGPCSSRGMRRESRSFPIGSSAGSRWCSRMAVAGVEPRAARIEQRIPRSGLC